MQDENEIKLGVIGCGGFGLFALQHFAQVDGVKLVAMAGTHRDAAIAAANRFGIGNIDDVDELLCRDDVDLVYIATPPFFYFSQAMAALQADKHVICEKPLALTVEQADEMTELAHAQDRLLVANLMQRYNPVADAVGQLIEKRILGEPLHGYFENYAADEGLTREHWFWDRDKSGGIFVEHGVHFFDLVASWMGSGNVVSAQRTLRPGSEIEEQVQCTVQYGSSFLMNFYHGFHQPGRLDRQELRIVFERGDVRLFEWVPTRVQIHGIVDESMTRLLCDLFPNAHLDVSEVYAPKDRACQGRHKSIDAYQLIEFRAGDRTPKMHRYGELLREMLTDQVAWIRDRNHSRRIDEQNGRDSLAMAIAADKLAICQVDPVM